MEHISLNISSLRNVCCFRENASEIIDRLTKKPISMRGVKSFKLEQLISHYGDDIYIFTDDISDYLNPMYIGFCKILNINDKKILSEFEIFEEHRGKKYGKKFAEKMYGGKDCVTFDVISEMLDSATLFWWKVIPKYFNDVLSFEILDNIPNNLPKEIRIETMKKEVKKWCKKYNHGSIATKLFNLILQHTIDNYDYETDWDELLQSLKNYIDLHIKSLKSH